MLLALGLAAGPTHPWVGNHTDTGDPIVWDAGDLPATFVIQDAGSDDVADASDDLAIRQAFAAWSSVDASVLAWSEDTDPLQTARTDWEADDVQLVLWDEDGTSGLFPPGSGLVAATVIAFDTGTGDLTDADVLFNGRDVSWSTDVAADTFDVRGVATHEAGHASGLAHSALLGASMAPFVSEGSYTQRILANDDAAAAEALYPGTPRGEITGTVTLNTLPVPGAHVWCSAGDGTVVSSALTAADGSYTLSGLDPGDYRVVAGPLDTPLTPADIGKLGGPTADTFFRQGNISGLAIVGAESLDAGTLEVGDDSAIAVLSPVDLQLVRKGETTELTMQVVGLVGGDPTVSVPGSGSLTIDNVVFDGGQGLTFDVIVPNGAPTGLFDIEVVTPLDTKASAAGMLQVIPKAAALSSIAPECGGSLGSEETFLTGTQLQRTEEVIFGDKEVIVITGAVNGFVGCFPPLHDAGLLDVIVINEVGEEARLPASFTFVDGGIPFVDSVFPPAGDSAGGTTLIITGDGFASDTDVLIGGIPAASVIVVSEELLEAVTPPLPVATYDVQVVQSGCADDLTDTLLDGFSSVSFGVDPSLASVTPDILSQSGGQAITIAGENFVNGAVVELFNDPLTGEGGTALTTVFVNAGQLTATTPLAPPPLPGGFQAAVVRLPGGQAALLEDAVFVDAPTLDAVSPDIIAQTGGVTLTITGTNFVSGATVELFTDLDDFTGGTALTTTFVDASELTAEVPTSLAPLLEGPANVAVIMPGPLFAGLADGLNILAPSLDQVSPTVYSPLGAETMTLTGFGFTPDAVVRLFADPGDLTGGTELIATVDSDTQITATTPDGPLPSGLATLAIDLPGDLVVGAVDGVEVAAPSLATVQPTELSPSGGETLTLTGTGFADTAVVRLFADPGDLTGGTVLATTVESSTLLTAITPVGPLPGGLATVAIDLPLGVIVGQVDAVNILFPSLESVNPTIVTNGGGEEITVTGTNFEDGAVVELFTDAISFDGGTAMETVFVDSTTLKAITPPGPLPLENVNVAVRMDNDVVVVLEQALGIVAGVSNGNKASGDLGEGDECDEVVFDAIAGTLITITHRRVGKTDLVPKLVVIDPNDVVLLSTDEADPEFDEVFAKAKDKSATVKKLVIAETGRHRFQIKRVSGAGEYKVVFRERLPKEAKKIRLTKKDGIVVGPDPHEIVFAAKAGTLVSGTFRGKKKEGLQLLVAMLDGPDGELLSMLEDGTVIADPDLVELVSLGKDMVSLRLKKFPLPRFGDYTLVWDAVTGTSGGLTGGFSLRAPKIKNNFEL